MAGSNESLTIIEKCRISAPPNSVGERSLELTFFDLGWLFFDPVHQFFAYEFPHSKTHFTQTIIPSLKHSLSITLQHFFPFAGNLIVFPPPKYSNTPATVTVTAITTKPEIRHVEGDSVTLTFAECDLDFNDLIGNHPRDCDKFHGLVPVLGNGEKVSDLMKFPLFSVQVTIFPKSGGITIGITNHHILCDASSKFDFLRAWTTIAKYGTNELFLATGVLPFYDRVIEYPNSLDQDPLNRLGMETLALEYKYPHPNCHADHDHKVRATIVLTRTHINQLKKWVSTQLPTLEYISSFSVACAYVWSCMAKSCTRLGAKNGEHELEMFVFTVDWRTRLNPPIPQSYFGNCVGPCATTAKSTLLSDTDGFLIAVELLGKTISEVVNNKVEVIKDAETWSQKFRQGLPKMGVAGTPKLKVYDLDYGWGKLKKYEVISIDYDGSMSINACKESPEDFEIGLSLPTKQMDTFIAIAENELERITNEQAKNE